MFSRQILTTYTLTLYLYLKGKKYHSLVISQIDKHKRLFENLWLKCNRHKLQIMSTLVILDRWCVQKFVTVSRMYECQTVVGCTFTVGQCRLHTHSNARSVPWLKYRSTYLYFVAHILTPDRYPLRYKLTLLYNFFKCKLQKCT